MKELQRLWKARAAFRQWILSAAKKAWPVGSNIMLHKWGVWNECSVLEVDDFYERLLVRNNRTGKAYRIDFAELLR
jgi:site-specific DNA-methyltransferase (adenine-specific)